ncbi:hypothetical protein DPMN_004192 [Dreissena polymorpha]|uniref:Uncharacterized protein n=1 Tax=Dreissena polymorpha TaxID=45954 RepID=A0A9D4MME2_DREPO|nr:hypothetical protein DPMN_004192 [Dreissena polymorpha]
MLNIMTGEMLQTMTGEMLNIMTGEVSDARILRPDIKLRGGGPPGSYSEVCMHLQRDAEVQLLPGTAPASNHGPPIATSAINKPLCSLLVRFKILSSVQSLLLGTLALLTSYTKTPCLS